MVTSTDLMVSALREVRGAEGALADQLRTHAAALPAGEYQLVLSRRAKEARGRVQRVDERLGELAPRGFGQAVVGGVWQVAGMTVRVPFEVAMSFPVAARRGKATEQELLERVEQEYGVTARAVAAARAGEHIATKTGDPASSQLLGSIRRADEGLLKELSKDLEQRADDLVAAKP